MLAVWDATGTSPGYAAMAELLERLFGDAVARALHVPFNLGHPDRLRFALKEAGLIDSRIETVAGTARSPSLEAWVETDVKGWTLANIIDDAQFDTLRRAVRGELTRFKDGDGTVSFAAPAHLVTYVRP